MADRSSQLILEALGRAALEPDGVALVANRGETGLFPATAASKALADRCREEGLLRLVRSETQGKNVREICQITEKGMLHLVREVSPKHLLEDFLRVLESRQDEIDSLAGTLGRMQESLGGMRSILAQVLPRMSPNSAPPVPTNAPTPTALARTRADTLISTVKSQLAEWHATAGASQDCPLPQLYRCVHAVSAPSVGEFHDILRLLHADNQVWLHPWTGPLYAMPEPAMALLVGHEIAYYGSLR